MLTSLVGFFSILSFITGIMTQSSVCNPVTCYGEASCHETQIPCSNGSALCKMTVPQCADKTVEDYVQALITSKQIEALVKDPNYANSMDKEVLCKGINCYGMNVCTIVRVPCINNPTCIKYLPLCDDKPF